MICVRMKLLRVGDEESLLRSACRLWFEGNGEV